MAIYDSVLQWLSGFVQNIVVAIVIILLGIILGKIVDRFTRRILHEVELNHLLKNAGIKIDLENNVAKFLFYIILIVSLIMALNQLGLATTVLNIIVAGVVILVIVTVVLSIKDLIPNAFAGIMMQKNKFFKEGDYVKIDDIEGKVVKMNLSETQIKTDTGDMIYVPNSTLYKKNFYVKKK